MTVTGIRRELRQQAAPERAVILQRFFKTGPGEYAAGDMFLGLTVPQLRALAEQYRHLPLRDTSRLLRSSIHEERFLALLVLVQAYWDGDAKQQRRIYDLYLRSTRYINNWDLVDCSAPQIVGAFLFRCSGGSASCRPYRTNDKRPALHRSAATILTQLARSDSLWERRIAIIATFHFIKHGEFSATLHIARVLLRDEHDLIHKAVGWMLREVGKRDLATEEKFLRQHCRQMPRTMLRYAIERFAEPKRRRYLKGTA
jgi:3-methyladenine DNA glycosylase AlkD